MKTLNQYIEEKLVLNSNSKIRKQQEYNYHPKTKDELKKLVEQLVEERGIEANLNDIDTSEINNMSYIFYYVKDFKGDISEWNVSNVTDMTRMFYECKNFNCDLSSWDVSKVLYMEGMFENCKNFEGKGLKYWKTNCLIDTKRMFKECIKFNEDISGWDMSDVHTIIEMFYNCENFDKDISGWNLESVEEFQGVFFKCLKLTQNHKPKIFYTKNFK
jgi:surface protein